jgi:hypothetical protein
MRLIEENMGHNKIIIRKAATRKFASKFRNLTCKYQIMKTPIYTLRDHWERKIDVNQACPNLVTLMAFSKKYSKIQ